MEIKTLEDKIQWVSFLHKQNLNGREGEDELFELGIRAGIEESFSKEDMLEAFNAGQKLGEDNACNAEINKRPPFEEWITKFDKY